MAAMSKSPIFKKLGVKPGQRFAVLNAPKGYTAILAKVPDDVSMVTRIAGEPFDVVQAFYEDRKSLKSEIKKLRKAIVPGGKVWVCWRKGHITNLSRETIWEIGTQSGLDSVGSCAIDDDWSAMKMMLPKKQRKG